MPLSYSLSWVLCTNENVVPFSDNIMINEIFLTAQLTYALTLNPKRLADVS